MNGDKQFEAVIAATAQLREVELCLNALGDDTSKLSAAGKRLLEYAKKEVASTGELIRKITDIDRWLVLNPWGKGTKTGLGTPHEAYGFEAAPGPRIYTPIDAVRYAYPDLRDKKLKAEQVYGMQYLWRVKSDDDTIDLLVVKR